MSPGLADALAVAMLLAAVAVAIVGGVYIGYSAASTPGATARRINSDPSTCLAAGGLLDGDEHSTTCVFTGTVPP